MPDPKKLRADANALVAELLQRLGGEGVHELKVGQRIATGGRFDPK